MSDVQTSTISESGAATNSQTADFDLSVDPRGERGPTPAEVLLADYAASFAPALREASADAGRGELGRIQIDADAETDDEGGLTAIDFVVHVEAPVGDPEELVVRAAARCRVHAALRDELHAGVTLCDDAF